MTEAQRRFSASSWIRSTKSAQLSSASFCGCLSAVMRNPRGEVAFYVNRKCRGARIRVHLAHPAGSHRKRNGAAATARATGLFTLLFLPAANLAAARAGVVEVIEAGDVEGLVVVPKDVGVLDRTSV